MQGAFPVFMALILISQQIILSFEYGALTLLIWLCGQ